MDASKSVLLTWGLCAPYLAFAVDGEFVRGDANSEGVIDVSDAVTVIRHLFAGRTLSCHDAADVNDDGEIDIADGVAALGFLFGTADPLPAPFPGCGAHGGPSSTIYVALPARNSTRATRSLYSRSKRGIDDTEDGLTCEIYAPCPARDPIISIAVFNVENLSQTELARSSIARVVTRVVREFDIVVIQEIRDPGEVVPERLLELVNATPGPPYDMVEGPRLRGREQYAIYYRREVVELVDAHVHPDPDGVFVRGVLVATFRSGAFDFTLLTTHTNHVGTSAELAELPAVFDAVLSADGSERDVLLLGDLNADCNSFDVGDESHALRAPRFHWVIPDDADTNVRADQDCSRDRIILLSATHDHEYVLGSAEVFLFDVEYGLETAVAVDVSDHYPVFARFDTSGPDDD